MNDNNNTTPDNTTATTPTSLVRVGGGGGYIVDVDTQLERIDLACDLLEATQGTRVNNADPSVNRKAASDAARVRRTLLEVADRLDQVASSLRVMTWDAKK